MKRVLITATKGSYPTICGEHDFATLDEAIEFAHYGSKGLGNEYTQYVVDIEPDKRFHPNIDAIVEIYDGYRE